MFSKLFIYRPVLACVISLLLVLLGLVSYIGLPVEQYPDLAPPVVHVEALYPGANAETIATTVARSIEQQVNGVDNMIYMSSSSVVGLYQLDISFKPGSNIDLSAVLVQNRVSIAEPTLPEEVRRLGVTTKKQSSTLVGVVSISSPDGQYDDLGLANVAKLKMYDEFSRVPGVGAINIFPNKEYSMRVWLNPNLLKERGVTATEVTNAIREQNVQVAAGTIGRPPAPVGTQLELVVNTLGRLTTSEQFRDIIVKTGDKGEGVLRLKDVARVELGSRDYSTIATFDGKAAAVMPMYQLPGTNLTAVADAVKAKLQEISPTLPKGIDARMFYDSSLFITTAQHEVIKTLYEAFILVAIVVLIFLQNWRTTLIPLLTIPVALVATFILMNLLGFSVNTLTLFGLVLAIGIVVDDAIVVVENVERTLAETTLSPKEATTKSMNEITGAVIAITLVLMCVFLPTAGLPGITGTMYRQFALTIAAATLFSALNALTLSPALCGLLLSRHDHAARPSKLRLVLTSPARVFNAVFDRIAHTYGTYSRLSSKLWPLTLLALAGVLVLTVFAYRTVPTGFVPSEDLGFVVVAATLPPGASLERTKSVIDRVNEIALGVDGVKDVVTLSGFSVLDGQGTSYGNAWIVLKDWDERYAHGRDVNTIMAELTQKTRPIQEASTVVFSLPPINGLGSANGFDLRVLDKGAGRQLMQQYVFQMLGNAQGQPTIAAAFPTFRAGVPQLYLNIDREKVKRFGVKLSDLFDTLQTSLGSTYANDFTYADRPYQVNVQADAAYRQVADDVLKLQVRNASGNMVPLASVLSITDAFGPEKITRYNLYPSAQIIGFPKPGVSSGDALAAMEGISDNVLPKDNMGYAWSSLSYQEKLVGNSGVYAAMLAILVVYLILAGQYESWTAPLAVVFSVPLVAIGAVVALNIAGLDNNVFTQVGLVLLIGLGAKNAILIVEFARQNRANGMGIVDSAVGAARQRLRPILMTSLAFIAGVAPLVFATGAGAASRNSLGTAVFGGMIGASLLGLLFTPTLYVVVQGLAETLKKPKPSAPTPVDHSAPAATV